MNENANAQFDPATIARLERLQARRAASGATQVTGPTPTDLPRKRRHPSKKSRVGALALSLTTTGGLTYAFATTASASATTAAPLTPASIVTTASATTASATTASATTASATTASATTASATTATAAPAATAATSGTSTTVNGAVFANKYGNVQVQVVFAADGSISAVNVLQSPDGDNKSVNINTRAVPVLNSEALVAQSANVHTVSGATYTTTGYVSSLQSAIDAARTAGITTLA